MLNIYGQIGVMGTGELTVTIGNTSEWFSNTAAMQGAWRDINGVAQLNQSKFMSGAGDMLSLAERIHNILQGNDPSISADQAWTLVQNMPAITRAALSVAYRFLYGTQLSADINWYLGAFAEHLPGWSTLGMSSSQIVAASTTNNWLHNGNPLGTLRQQAAITLSNTTGLDFFQKVAILIGNDNVRSWDSVLGSLQNGWFAKFSNFAAGAGDALSMGLTARIRGALGYDDVVDRQSAAYSAGQITGTALGVVLSFANPCTLLQSGRLAGVVAGRGLQALNGVQAVAGAFNFADNMMQGKYLAAAEDAFGMLGNLTAFGRACFVAGTLVETKSGWKPIEKIVSGLDEVASRDEDDPYGRIAYKRVELTVARWAFVFNLHLEEGRVPCRPILTR